MAPQAGQQEQDNRNSAPSAQRDLFPLVTTLLLLICVILACGIALYFVRRYRQQRKNIRRPPLTISTTMPWKRNSHGDIEKQGLVGNSSPSPMSPDSIPEIRITFPEEEDAQGRRKSGRVVIVQVGEAGVGFVRPVPEDQLPPYEHDGFSSIDLEKIGGLKEKDSPNAHHWV